MNRYYLILVLAAACTQPPPATTPLGPAVPSAESPTAVPTDAVVEVEDETQAEEICGSAFNPYRFNVGAAPLGVGDFNADGRLDVLSAGVPELTVLLGDGLGGLVAAGRVPGGPQPNEIAVADFDEDGRLDAAIANHDTSQLTILLGDGAGAFSAAPYSPLVVDVLPHVHSVRAVDLDSDGHIDLVVDHRELGGLVVLRGLGPDGFEPEGRPIEVGGDPYLGMALGDLDGDGRIDLVTPNPAEVGVVLNRSEPGAISFGPPEPLVGVRPFAVGLGDFNGDGLLDLIAAADEGSVDVVLFWGDGRGGFSRGEEPPLIAGAGGKNIVVGDFNGDGSDDAAVVGYLDPGILVLFGGEGGVCSGYLSGDQHPWGLAAADLNGDGADELLVADDVTGQAVVWMWMGD